MQKNKKILNQLILYEVYVRNHGPNGTFEDVIRDLGRIKALGVDVIWLMPIHPIGERKKKGTLGCPYSIRDYRKINPEYGTLYDFQELIKEAHRRDLKIMMDIVFNHTAHDSILIDRYPEFFHLNEDGQPFTTVPAWSDVIDLKHPNQGLRNYLIDTLIYWVEMGVDGFRCDVASIIPLSFWIEAKRKVEAINPDFIWLAESVHAAFVIDRRKHGLIAHADSELYQAFDLTYDYDIWPIWQAAVLKKLPVRRYLEMLVFQNAIYPADAIKMRCVENHDNPRIMALAHDEISARAWTAFEIFNQGAFLIYAGQESSSKHTPSLFDVDKIVWGDYALQDWLRRLIEIKKSHNLIDAHLEFYSSEPAIQAAWESKSNSLFGIFNVNATSESIPTKLLDGDYLDIISGKQITAKDGRLIMGGQSAVIFELDSLPHTQSIAFDLLSFEIN